MVRSRLQQPGLSARGPLLGHLLTTQHEERRLLWFTERQRLTQRRHNVIFLDKSQFCVKYSDDHVRVWRLQEDQSTPACTATGYTTRTSRVSRWIDYNLNADQYISDIYLQWLFPIFKGCQSSFFNKTGQVYALHIVF
ncbi:hypothetical protein TNCV_3773501 [Trichonephila clavipes]|nr:hypothetical protein TNCV_3773501 [Trichonephila clavipes]